MNTRLLCLVLSATAPVAFAQKVLVVAEPNGPQVVHSVVLGESLIEVNGKLVNATGTQFALQKAAIYRKGFIKFSELALKETRMEDSTGGTMVTYGNDIDTYITSDLSLKRCFIVLEVTADHEKGNFTTELSDLVAGVQQRIRVSARLHEHLAEKDFVLHVFSDGLEILNSTMSPDYVAEQMKKTDEFILKRQPDRMVAMSRGTPPAVPVYPAELKAQGTTGSAKVSCTIDPQGAVVAVEVVDATHPLFGESLAAAARQWKFEPAVKDHQYVQATAVIPYNFKLPGAPAAK